MSVPSTKWPVHIQIVRVVQSPLPEKELFLLSGEMNANQFATLEKRLPVLSSFSLGGDRVMVATLVNLVQLKGAYAEFARLAKDYRGQYYALADQFVVSCRPLVE